MTDDVLGAWPVGWTILDQLLHLVVVVQGHRLREGQVLGNWFGNTQLLKREVWVGSDHSSRAEIDSLSHQVASEPSFLTFESSPECPQLLARLVLLLWLASDVVVHESRHVELQQRLDVVQHRLVRALLNVSFELIVHLEDLLVGVSQVVLRSAHVGHLDRWPDTGRSHNQVLDEHPLWSAKGLVEAKQLEVLVRNASQDLVDVLGLQELLSVFGCIKVVVVMLSCNSETFDG